MAGAFLQWRARTVTAMLGRNRRGCGGFGAARCGSERKANGAGDSVGQAHGVLKTRPAVPGCPWHVACASRRPATGSTHVALIF